MECIIHYWSFIDVEKSNYQKIRRSRSSYSDFAILRRKGGLSHVAWFINVVALTERIEMSMRNSRSVAFASKRRIPFQLHLEWLQVLPVLLVLVKRLPMFTVCWIPKRKKQRLTQSHVRRVEVLVGVCTEGSFTGRKDRWRMVPTLLLLLFLFCIDS